MTADAKQVGGSHYVDKKVQPCDAMEAWMTPQEFVGFLRGNAIKYLARCNDKGGVEDIKKARHYLDKLIEFKSLSRLCAPPTNWPEARIAPKDAGDTTNQ